MPSVGLEVVREDVATVAARTSSYYRANDADVTVPAQRLQAGRHAVEAGRAATLRRPRGSGKAPPARLPAVVLIAGSGPLDRDETVAGIPVFAQLANALADAGFAVVRYDKRGIGQSGGRAESATLPTTPKTSAPWSSSCEKRKDIDKKRIALVGHSEGAARRAAGGAADGTA